MLKMKDIDSLLKKCTFLWVFIYALHVALGEAGAYQSARVPPAMHARSFIQHGSNVRTRIINKTSSNTHKGHSNNKGSIVNRNAHLLTEGHRRDFSALGHRTFYQTSSTKGNREIVKPEKRAYIHSSAGNFRQTGHREQHVTKRHNINSHRGSFGQKRSFVESSLQAYLHQGLDTKTRTIVGGVLIGVVLLIVLGAIGYFIWQDAGFSSLRETLIKPFVKDKSESPTPSLLVQKSSPASVFQSSRKESMRKRADSLYKALEQVDSNAPAPAPPTPRGLADEDDSVSLTTTGSLLQPPANPNIPYSDDEGKLSAKRYGKSKSSRSP